MADRGLTGVLLVGGTSSRFGSPKALARLDGETLAERAWRLLGDACDERLAVGKHADGLALPFPLLDDATDIRAPIAGVVAGLRAAAHDVAVIVPVDSPLLLGEDLHALATACAAAAVPQTGPLPGAYRKHSLPVLERRLAAGDLALRDALIELETRVVELPPERLANVNTRAELARLGTPPIVRLRPEHVTGLRALVFSVLGEYGLSEDPHFDGDLADPEASYVAAWVVLDGDSVVGSVAFQDRGAGVLLLRRMYLVPAARGRGIGRRLVEVALGWAREHDYREIVLDTMEAMTEARALYESVGFGPGDPIDDRQGCCRVHYRLRLVA
jgi:molybdenum cofactor guanylyltransferase